MSEQKEEWLLIRKRDVDFILEQLKKIKDEAKQA